MSEKKEKKGFMGKVKAGVAETKTAAGLEMKYVAGKKSGYKHSADMEVELNVLRQNRDEIPILRERISNFSSMQKHAAEAETKGSVEFHGQAEKTSHPQLGEIYKRYGQALSSTSAHRYVLYATMEEVKDEWKKLETVDLHEIKVKQDQTNRASSDQQYWHGQKKHAKAAEYESKYNALSVELVQKIEELRMKKEEFVPGYLLKIAQEQVIFARAFLKEAEALEASIKAIGAPIPIPFNGIDRFIAVANSTHLAAPEHHHGGHSPTEGSSPRHGDHSPKRSHSTGQAAPAHHATPHGAPVHHNSTPQPHQAHHPQQPQAYAQHPQAYSPVPAPVPTPMLRAAPSPHPQAKGLYPFNAEAAHELSFQPGDVLLIISQEGQWWTAELNGRRGSIPCNYVQMI